MIYLKFLLTLVLLPILSLGADPEKMRQGMQTASPSSEARTQLESLDDVETEIPPDLRQIDDFRVQMESA